MSPRRMEITGPGQQHLALGQRERTSPPSPQRRHFDLSDAPCPAGIPGPARRLTGLSLGGSRARLGPLSILPPLHGRGSAPAAFPGPASLRSQPHHLFPESSPFSRERAPFACVTAPVPHSCGGGSGGDRGSSKRRGGAATLPTARPPRPFPPPHQPYFRDRSRRVIGTALSRYHWLQGSRGPSQSREERPGNPTCCGLVHFRREEHFLEFGC